MNDQIHKLTEQFHTTCDHLGQSEQVVLQKMKARLHVSRNTNREFDVDLTFGQRCADKIAAFGGSWPFIFLFFGMLLGWIALNSLILVRWEKHSILTHIFCLICACRCWLRYKLR